jgi:hypothetical protein
MRSNEADLQISFFYRLQEIRTRFLQEALFGTIGKIDVVRIDEELKEHVDIAVLNKIARFGIRAEVFIPVPALIRENPRLIGNYRLLYGISQKEFYKSYAKLKAFEEYKGNRQFSENEILDAISILVPIGEALVR